MKLGIRAKLTIAISMLVLAFAGFFSVYFPMQQASTAKALVRAHAVSLAAVIGNLSDASVANADAGGAETLNSDLAKAGHADPSIMYLVALQPSGAVVARYRAPAVSEDLERREATARTTVVETDHSLHIGVPLFHDNKQIGTLVAGFTLSAVTAASDESQRVALGISAVLFAIGIGFAWIIGRTVANPVRATALELDHVAIELVATARQQEASSAEEAAAVTETRRSMELLLESAQQIAAQSSDVLGNAERTVHGNRQIGGRIEELNDRAEKVGEVLTTIMQIADRADLLALNASLEGTKAGDVGKGFTLVAAEMRRLAENIMAAAGEIRALVREIRQASQAAVAASHDGVTSSDATTGSARQIARLTQQQRQATEQVITSMAEMQEVLRLTTESIQRSTQSAGKLASLAGALLASVEPTTSGGRTRASADHQK